MSFEIYKVIHITGLLFLFTAFGGILLHVMAGGKRDYPLRKLTAALHGTGLLLLLIAGFGMVARMKTFETGPSGWVFGKLAIWAVLGGLPALIYRQPQKAKAHWGLVLILGVLAAYLAIFKPF